MVLGENAEIVTLLERGLDHFCSMLEALDNGRTRCVIPDIPIRYFHLLIHPGNVSRFFLIVGTR